MNMDNAFYFITCQTSEFQNGYELSGLKPASLKEIVEKMGDLNFMANVKVGLDQITRFKFETS